MHSLRGGIIEAKVQLRVLLFRWKTGVVILALTVILISYLQPLAAVTKELNVSINPFEPFLLLVNSGESFPSTFFYIYFFYIILLSDQPLISNGFRYRIIRMGKTAWYIGQIVTLITFSFLYIFVIYSISVLPFINVIGPWNEWSKCVVSLTKTNMAAQRGIEVMLDVNIIRGYTPEVAFVYSAILLLSFIFVSGLFVVALHTQSPSIRPAGAGILLAVYLFDYIRIYFLPYYWIKYSITAMARLASINNGYSLYAPDIEYVSWVWNICLVIMLFLLWIASRNVSNSLYCSKEDNYGTS